MKLDNIDVNGAIDSAEKIIEEDKTISDSVRSLLKLLLLIVTLLLNKLTLDSSNSSKPPSSDLNKNKRKQYDILLMRDNENSLTDKKLKEISENNNSLPILIITSNNEFKVYGNSKGAQWKTTPLSSIKELKALELPRKNQTFIKLDRIDIDPKIFKEISSKDGHTHKKKRNKLNRKPGGQEGHPGVTLEPVSNPDEIKSLSIDRRTLPKGEEYKPNGYVARQVININISKTVTEYRAESLLDGAGNEYIAEFPNNLTRPIQYGSSVKASITYASVYQLIPYERTQEQLSDEYNIPISTGSICNFNYEAANKLRALGFERVVKEQLIKSALAHADETGLNVNGSKIWLHGFSNEDWTWLEPHIKRGCEAMNDIGITPQFSGVLCHDHWKAYFTYKCYHSLCNAHHLRELTRAYKQDGQLWAKEMRVFLTELNDEVNATEKGALSKKKSKARREYYREILATGGLECPFVEPKSGTKRKSKQSKARNLLDRLRDYENEVLRFMIDPLVPFTNNFGERELRMTKVQQKISGCFRSMEGAMNFCITRSYISTCIKNGISGFDALEMLFNDELPAFIQEKLDSS